MVQFQEVKVNMITSEAEKIGRTSPAVAHAGRAPFWSSLRHCAPPSCSCDPLPVDVMLKGREVAKGTGVRTLTSDMDQLEASMERLLDLLTVCKRYVDSVVVRTGLHSRRAAPCVSVPSRAPPRLQDGTTPADVTVGRMIADTLAAVPRIDPAAFHKIFHTSLQDLLMVCCAACRPARPHPAHQQAPGVTHAAHPTPPHPSQVVYLSNLTRTQLALAEKIKTLV